MNLMKHSRLLAMTVLVAACGSDNQGVTPEAPDTKIQAEPSHAEENAARYAALEAEFLGDARCKAEVDEVLLGARGIGQQHPYASLRQWSKVASGRDGSVTLVSPTALPGMWTIARRYMNREVVVERMSARFTTSYRFAVGDDGCTIEKDDSVTRSFDEELMARSFTDKDVLALVKSQPRGVIYVWSPHMPYSYSAQQEKNGANGIKNIEEAVRLVEAQTGQSLALTIAADPGASPDLIDGLVAAEPSLEPTMGRPVQSIELLFRDVNHHYPALLVFEDGRISRHVYPGVESPEKYASYILGQLAELGAHTQAGK